MQGWTKKVGDVLNGMLGADGIKLWNIQSRKEIACPSQDACAGAVSCAIWIKTRHSVVETLCYGTGLGYLVFLRPNPVDVRVDMVVV